MWMISFSIGGIVSKEYEADKLASNSLHIFPFHIWKNDHPSRAIEVIKGKSRVYSPQPLFKRGYGILNYTTKKLIKLAGWPP